MKESPRRYINPFLPDEENDKVNYVTNLEDENFKKSLEPSSVSNAVEKAYVDKNVTETYYEESNFHDVKDICVDEGLSNKENNESETEHHVDDGDKHDDMIKVDLGNLPLEDCEKKANLLSVTEDFNVSSNCAPDELKQFVESDTVQSKVNLDPDSTMQNGEINLDSDYNSSADKLVSEDVLELSNKIVNDDHQQLSEVKSTESGADKSNEIKDENCTLDFDNVKPAIVIGPHEPLLDTQNALNQHEMAPDNIPLSKNQLHAGDESAFSVAVPVSGLITYSDPISSAGNISHRSDGSNTSVRSFAFPILQNEWNSSPIRMAKADSRRSRKHRGWRQALLCCRF
ncbi:uncharacterized protein [Rutidosis leptorrhynchoides]|uniref:uncharacterized protein n=1 Tax=Rutidosis leptorrhynchoides TaxID=125765 RepID=UPI003A9A1F69